MYTVKLDDYHLNIAQSCITLANEHENNFGSRPEAIIIYPATLKVDAYDRAWRDEGEMGGIRVISSPLCPPSSIYAVSKGDLEWFLRELELMYLEMKAPNV